MFNPKKTWLFFLSLCISTMLFAQTAADNAETSGMRRDGKIYVVVAVVITILLGLIIYVARLDRKISKLEKDNK